MICTLENTNGVVIEFNQIRVKQIFISAKSSSNTSVLITESNPWNKAEITTAMECCGVGDAEISLTDTDGTMFDIPICSINKATNALAGAVLCANNGDQIAVQESVGDILAKVSEVINSV